jgi:DNA-binding beta-propeller fold protein YncE/cytochrome c peroxidase
MRTAACVVVCLAVSAPRGIAGDAPAPANPFRSPADVAILAGESLLVSANAGSGSVSLIERATGRLLDELAVGSRPTAIVAAGPGRAVVSVAEAGDLVLLEPRDGRLVELRRIHVGDEPRGLAVAADGRRAWVALSMGRAVAAVDLEAGRTIESIEVGGLPRHVTLSPDGRSLAVACAGRAEIVIVSAAALEVVSRQRLPGVNPGQPAFAPDGGTLYFPWTYDGGGHPSKGNIRLGWVTGSRIGRLRLDVPEAGGDTAVPRLTGLTLDVSGRAVGDVSGMAVAEGGKRLLVSAGGTHEILRFDGDALPFTQASASEVMDRRLAADRGRFRRLVVEGRPLGMTLSADGSRLFVANHLLDAVQEIDVGEFALVATHPVAPGGEPDAAADLVRKGEAIFHDAGRCLDQWYSCHTCHFEGGGNAATFDTLNDGSTGSYKTVLPLYRLAETGPWTWHGWQGEYSAALRKSLVDTMQGPEPSDDDVAALGAYLAALPVPSSPRRRDAGGLSPAAARGRELFQSDRTACTRCHAGPLFTTPEVVDVGLGRPGDRYEGHSPPMLAGVSRKTLFMHDGKEKSLRDVLAGRHSPERVSGLDPLTDDEITDLVAFLESL